MSTTGVYGNRDGGWVDEEAETAPNNHRSELRVKAEQDWLALWRDHGVPAHIFRLAGIYGPGRSPLDQVRSGRARRLVKPGLVLGRIHLADIVGTVMASIAKPNPGPHLQRHRRRADAAAGHHRLRLRAAWGSRRRPKRPTTGAELPPIMREFYEDCKRVSNKRLKEELGYTFKHPTFRDGLRALLAKEQAG